MLQAIVKDKARSFFLKDGRRVPREDILTDCLLGGLRYLSPQEATTLLRWMLGDLVSQEYQLSEITLWPKEENREPDARLILLAEQAPPITIIVEAKWGKNRLTAAQLDHQWRIFATPAIGSVCHLLLLEHRKRIEYLAYEGAPMEVKQHRVLVTWSDIAARLLHRNRELGSKETNHLASDIAAVLQHSGQKPFYGWSTKSAISAHRAESLFYKKDPWWQTEGIVSAVTGPMFFSNEVIE